MSKKTALDILGESHIPADLLTNSLGSNYGLDGFEDLQYGIGVLEGIEDPNLGESPAFPTGLSKGGGLGDLTAMLEEQPLADLDWLDPTQHPDPDRLPKNPVALAIPELEEAWGVNRRTDGVTHIARDLERARYEDSVKNGSVKRKATAKQMAAVVTHAMRRSAAHQDIDVVTREAMESMGEEMDRIAGVMRTVRAEHGLVGNVYIRASAFPGYGTGKWSKIIKRIAAGANYILVDEATMKTATWIQNGRCAYTSKKVVTEIPWKEAFSHYAPRLELGGRKVASGDKREALRQAFLSTPEKRVVESNLPTHRVPLEKMSSAEAKQRLAQVDNSQPVYDEQKNRVARGVAKVATAIKAGKRGQVLAHLIRSTFLGTDMPAAVKQLKPLLKNGELTETRKEAKQFNGPAFQAHSMVRVANLGDPNANIMSKTASAALRWIRRAMSEGFAGKPLDDLIDHRFANALLGEIAEPLQTLREAHEGGAGFLYVDASAYASPTGITGCEEGALKHRANQVPAISQMDRCGSCSMVRTLQDGTKKCALYNKALLENTTGREMDGLRAANVRVANMTDAEQTAAMFATPENAYDPSEFGLRNGAFDDIDAPLPDNEKMASITFGGWDIE